MAVVVGSVLPWFKSVRGSPSATAFKIPFSFLIDPTKRLTGPKIGLILLLVGVVGALLTFVPVTGVIRRLLGTAAVLIGGVFLGQLAHSLSNVPGGISVTSVAGLGVYISIVGGLLLAAGR
jgi:hypothetical protein